MKKVMIFSGLITAPLVIALIIFVAHIIIQGQRDAAFSSIREAKVPMTVAAVEKAMGPPARIEQSGTNDQTIAGQVYHYPTSTGADRKVVFVNGTVFKAELVPGAKS